MPARRKNSSRRPAPGAGAAAGPAGDAAALLADLNAAQRRAVTHGEGPLLVVAGAGTGKTRVITARIAWLLSTQPDLRGENILGLTYTNKAAGLMKSGLISMVGERGRSVHLSTFHSFCHTHILEPLQPGLRAIDDKDHWVLLRRNIALLELRHFKRAADPGQFLDDFTRFFSRCQDEMISPADFDAYARRQAQRYAQEKAALDAAARAAREQEIEKLAELARAYAASEALLREKNLVTYGGQMFHAVRHLRDNTPLREMLQERFRHILVDEFQDSNHAQIELLRLLGGRARNIVVVGDDDQAIYQFRGASHGTFQIFKRDFLGSFPPEEQQRRVVLLDENYRSTKRILCVANHLIGQNGRENRFLPDKQLATANPEGERVRIAAFERAEGEAEWIAAELERMHAAGLEWGQAAVLYRIHAHRDMVLDALMRRGIPFVVRGLDIFENPAVRDLLAHLRLMHREADNVALVRAAAAPAWGFSARALQRLGERAGRANLWDALVTAAEDPQFLREAPGAADFVAFFRRLRNLAAGRDAHAALEMLIAELSLDLPAENPHKAFLSRFREFVRQWKQLPITEKATLGEFLDYLGYFRDAGGAICLEEERSGDAVTLMTVHSAKGLEFPFVFVVRMSSRSFPLGEKPPVIRFPDELSKELRVAGRHIQEERRLCYVAMTRAMRQLTLTGVERRGIRISPFITDIQENSVLVQRDVEVLTPAVPPAAPRVAPPAAGLPPRAGSLAGRWASEYHAFVPRPLKLSDSSIEMYQRCPLQFFFSEIWNVRGMQSASTTFGIIMHSAIRQFILDWKEGRRWSAYELENFFLSRWRSSGFEDTYQEEEYKREGHEQLRAFHEFFSARPDDMHGLEMRFELPLEDDLIITGRIDQVNRLADGAHEILDYKTGRERAQKDADTSLQLSLYFLAARDFLSLQPARVALHYLVSSRRVASSRDDKSLDGALQQVQTAAEGIRAGNFKPAPGYVCKYCDYELVCPEHEELVVLRA